VRQHRNVLQPETKARQERDAVTRRIRTAAGNVNRGCPRNSGLFIATLPAAGPRDAAALLVDIAYEPHWQRGEARALTPEAVIVRLGAEDWRADAPEYAPPTSDRFHWPPLYVEGNLYRFTFGPDLVAAMLAASETAPRRYGDLYGDAAQGVLRFEILFRGVDGDIVSSNDILEIDSGTCETNCQ